VALLKLVQDQGFLCRQRLGISGEDKRNNKGASRKGMAAPFLYEKTCEKICRVQVPNTRPRAEGEPLDDFFRSNEMSRASLLFAGGVTPVLFTESASFFTTVSKKKKDRKNKSE
jgi:hypothetical protein